MDTIEITEEENQEILRNYVVIQNLIYTRKAFIDSLEAFLENTTLKKDGILYQDMNAYLEEEADAFDNCLSSYENYTTFTTS